LIKNCSIPECKKTARCRGWCSKHYEKWRQWGDPLHVVERQTVCSVEGCDGKVDARGWCPSHYNKWVRWGDPLHVVERQTVCSVEGCDVKVHGTGYCKSHYHKNRTYGDPLHVVTEDERRTKISKGNTGKKRTQKVKDQISDSLKGNVPWNKGKTGQYVPTEETKKKTSKSVRLAYADGSLAKKISEHHSTPEMKKVFQDILKQTRKNMGRPNIPEKTIGKILEEIGIKVKFLQDIDYKTLENKLASKEMDIVWKDSLGNKKIIEYNGYYHFDNRKYGPDEIHEVHGKPTVVKDLWDNEEMILNQIRKAGYRILIVWEKDFLKDYENEVKRIIEFATKT